MMHAKYRKAIAAALTGVLGLAAMFVPEARDALSVEGISAIAGIVATVLVYVVPNAA